MSESSNIEWTDATWNPVRGCTKVSPGCKNCYAETFAERFRGVKGHPYEQGFDLRLVPDKLAEPLTWKKPRRVFVNSMSDLFHEDLPREYIAEVFSVMARTPQHTYQVLTKRPERMLMLMLAPLADGVPWPLPNVWLGVSVENQHFADKRIPLLLQTPAAVRFISAEPLLDAVDLESYVDGPCQGCGIPDLDCAAFKSEGAVACCPDCRHRSLDWVIVGGESGPGARPFNLEWARSIVQQCTSAAVPAFIKQLGAHPYRQFHVNGGTFTDPMLDPRLKSRKGGDPLEWPEDLRVRQFPEMRSHALVR
jgi:protein gp37